MSSKQGALPSDPSMEWKTILVHADPSAHAPARIRVAAQLAKAFQAHLVGVAATGISRDACASYEDCGDIIRGYLDPVYDGANRCLDEFEAIARASGAPSWERHLASDLPEDGIARRAAFCDLVVMSQNDPAESTSLALSDLPEYVILNCARPVLLVPRSGNTGQLGAHVLIAFNGSNEAVSAIASALPLVSRARQVTVVMFDPQRQDHPPGVRPVDDLSAWLARHGVKAEVQARPAGANAGLALVALIGELGADLLVMGCYGHTRLRELLLGGATRTILDTMFVPVLMAH
jgi:nucleotide-binding universal stress UspA family protein